MSYRGKDDTTCDADSTLSDEGSTSHGGNASCGNHYVALDLNTNHNSVGIVAAAADNIPERYDDDDRGSDSKISPNSRLLTEGQLFIKEDNAVNDECIQIIQLVCIITGTFVVIILVALSTRFMFSYIKEYEAMQLRLQMNVTDMESDLFRLH